MVQYLNDTDLYQQFETKCRHILYYKYTPQKIIFRNKKKNSQTIDFFHFGLLVYLSPGMIFKII